MPKTVSESEPVTMWAILNSRTNLATVLSYETLSKYGTGEWDLPADMHIVKHTCSSIEWEIVDVDNL